MVTTWPWPNDNPNGRTLSTGPGFAVAYGPAVRTVSSRPRARIAPLLVSLVVAVSCRSAHVATTDHLAANAPLVQPGAPGDDTRPIDAARAADLSHVQFTPADVRFMQGMIGHHAQALEMTALLKTRTGREDMKLLALRIEVSQADEIRMMERWLEVRGQPAPDVRAHHAHELTPMPGMLTSDQMARLAGATGTAFDRLFLESMMAHHEGALVMVRELFAASGAAQDSEMFAFASDVEADQQGEIERMGALLRMLRELPP